MLIFFCVSRAGLLLLGDTELVLLHGRGEFGSPAMKLNVLFPLLKNAALSQQKQRLDVGLSIVHFFENEKKKCSK